MLAALLLGCGAAAFHVGAPRAAIAPRASASRMVESWYDSGVRLTADTAVEAIYCNEMGCWVGEAPPPPVTLPDGRTLSADIELASSEEGKVVPTKRKPVPQGIFAPAVLATKELMGTKELNKLRASVIAEHTKVISSFVDTSESAFGQIVLRRMFEAADKDGNGTLDRQEVQEALRALGFTFIQDAQMDKIMDRADIDGNDVIDFEEFVKETPKTLRTSIVKLAKQNGHDLGFLA